MNGEMRTPVAQLPPQSRGKRERARQALSHQGSFVDEGGWL